MTPGQYVKIKGRWYEVVEVLDPSDRRGAGIIQRENGDRRPFDAAEVEDTGDRKP